MKVFISQAMRGLTDEEILEARKEAIERIKANIPTKENDEIEVIDSFFQSAPTEARPLWYLGKSLELLSTADICVFIGDWQQARGCRIEHECCIEYGIPVAYISKK